MSTSRRGPALPKRLPLLPLRSTMVFPYGVSGLQIGTASTLEMLAANPEDNALVALTLAPGDPDEPLDVRALGNRVGVMARLTDRLNLPGGTVQVTVQGLRRVRLREAEDADGYYTARVGAARETTPDPEHADDAIARVLGALEALAQGVERVSKEVPRILRMNVTDPSRFADLVATLANFSVRSKDEVLQRLNVQKRLDFVLEELESQLHRVRQVEDSARAEAAEAPAEGPQRIAELRRRIRLMQAELGEIDPVEREIVDLLRRIEVSDMPARATTRARAEVERLRVVPAASPEAGDIRSYVDWLLHLPWQATATEGAASIDIEAVQQTLSDELLGLDEPRDRLLDYLSVARLRADLRGPIPCLVGPPAVGKTALACALARGLGRPVAKLELGGRGESYVVGTRRTRPGAHPGRIVDALRDAGVRDPLLLLEEIDEIGTPKAESETAEALEEALTWDGREFFVDRYLDLDIDLSEALFIATAQDFYRIPRDLRELLLEVRIAGYTPEEKVAIARERLLPRLIGEHGLESDDLEIGDKALLYLTRGYARDAGLGLLRRALSTLLRTRARAKAQGDTGIWTFGAERIEEILGPPRFVSTVAENSPEVGVVTGLAWTSAGGDLMFIEALRMPGSGRLLITGLLGDVMRESVNAAYSYVRSRGDALGIDDEIFRESDLHVHFPEGAIPKDGPSAGIAVTLAIASTLSNRPVRHDVAMTGEVTLRGKVLEVGGIKEKVLAAYRAGIREILLPEGNERDLRDVPADVREKITFHFVERMDDVLAVALLRDRRSRRGGKPHAPPTEAPTPRAARPGNRR